MFKQQFCLPHLWLINFATETEVCYVCSWYNIATVLKWQFCFVQDVFQLSLARSKVHMRTWISLIMEYTHHISTSCMPYNIRLCVQVVWSSEWNRLTARCFSDIHTNMERPHPTHMYQSNAGNLLDSYTENSPLGLTPQLWDVSPLLV